MVLVGNKRRGQNANKKSGGGVDVDEKHSGVEGRVKLSDSAVFLAVTWMSWGSW